MLVLDKIHEWQRDPSELEEPGLTPPTEKSLLVAELLAGMINPSRVVPDGDGGVSFSWSGHGFALDIEEDGSLGLLAWDGLGIMSRLRWTLQEVGGE